MKGIIFNLVETIVSRAHGADAWDRLLDVAELDGAYTTVGAYPDAELFALVDAAAADLGMSSQSVLRWVGRESLPLLAQRYPHFFEPPTTRGFVLTLNHVIHPEVRKLYPGADVPVFAFAAHGEDGLSIDYRSHRRMCGFAEGLIQGAGDHYGEEVRIEQPRCMLEGGTSCQLVCEFLPLARSAASG